MRHTRRTFAKTAGLAGAAILGAPAINVLGANDEIRIAVCGVNGKGFQDASQFRKIKGVRVVALCDPDSKVLADRIKRWQNPSESSGKKSDKKGGNKSERSPDESPDEAFAEDEEGAVDAVQLTPAKNEKIDGHIDFREVLDRKDVDAICIATPNHWHSLMAIMACQAGKDVYVEKPVSHSIYEGRVLVEAAHRYNRIVQAGTQNRSDVGLLEFFPWLAAGNLGKVKMVRGLCYRDRKGIGKQAEPLKPPETVDYNLWLGPAQDLPMFRKKFHYDWHWVWNTGNGDIGNQGPHEMDLIRWAMGDASVPTRVVSFGGRFQWDDGGETPNMQFAAYDYNGIPVFFEVRNLNLKPDLNSMPNYLGGRVGIVVTCEGGYFVGGRGGGKAYDNDKKMIKQFKGDGGGKHQANFIDAMRSRKESDLRAPVEKGHLSASLAHMANVAYRVGDQVSPGELRERMKDDKEALDAIERYSEQLAAWSTDFAKTPWTASVSLGFDPKTERFTGKGELVDKANALVKGEYRKPFELPKLA